MIIKKEVKLVFPVLVFILIFLIYIRTNYALSTTFHPLNIKLNITKPIKVEHGGNISYIFNLEVRNGIGKNLIQFPFTPKNLRAADILKSLKYADAISYFDPLTNKTVGYVTAFGGIGKNFVIEANKTYEISVRKNITWTYIPE